ncbi:MAG: 3-deoxy-7-phosphoheptulonate synthase [Acidobacteriota bacterium]|nr:3-deoxy-7-phosphoheptulonate synthase [Acidobacteriota bacterium]
MKDISELDLKNNLPLVARRDPAQRTIVRVGSQPIGDGGLTLIGGPCAVESLDQVVDIAEHVKEAGATILRGGAFKPLTFPYRSEKTFELREQGIEFLAEAKRRTGLPVVSEIMDAKHLPLFEQHVDMLQVGSRNMQNFPLLLAIAATGKPVLLKRHFGCSLRDWLGAAEYLLYHGNPNVVLCERGVTAPHTHQVTSRFIVDLQVVPAVREVTHLPIIVDPSHATFRRSFVPPVSRAAVAIGADGVMLDVHPVPEKAAVDPLQALDYASYRALAGELRAIAGIVAPRA